MNRRPRGYGPRELPLLYSAIIGFPTHLQESSWKLYTAFSGLMNLDGSRNDGAQRRFDEYDQQFVQEIQHRFLLSALSLWVTTGFEPATVSALTANALPSELRSHIPLSRYAPLSPGIRPAVGRLSPANYETLWKGISFLQNFYPGDLMRTPRTYRRAQLKTRRVKLEIIPLPSRGLWDMSLPALARRVEKRGLRRISVCLLCLSTVYMIAPFICKILSTLFSALGCRF